MRLIALFIILFSLATGTMAADAVIADEEVASPDEQREWEVLFTSYVWATGLEGDIGVGGRPAIVTDTNFGDILDDLDFSFMSTLVAHNGEWGIFADFYYVDVTQSSSYNTLVGGVPTNVNAQIGTETLMITLMGEYRVLEDEQTTVDMMAGARLWHLKGELDVRANAGGAEIASLSGEGDKTWVDPMVGLHSKHKLNDKWELALLGMIGGFGASSDLTWETYAGLNYHLTDKISTSIGYRGLGVDFQEDGFTYDTVQHGPIMGLTFKF